MNKSENKSAIVRKRDDAEARYKNGLAHIQAVIETANIETPLDALEAVADVLKDTIADYKEFKLWKGVLETEGTGNE